ncbi:carboxymuconolactone decarboxylase family protein [Amycolatopsis sp. H20-H5]|uniref:carboxymuconolactone decarboxylase family protein n=1 Tax=Amycolatopsis sp. H20-H5 TaxID=3046309 RepID=UPI002DBF4612|nr:carboxymuconolactone decarboxylase family protein [Amycolatopsis sp. H20-H5]MEC3976553.1 carboxymuconolactone decarboxylase family protein [Amycolatopsis sp. H20-H5]
MESAEQSFEQGLKLIQRLGGQERPAVLDLFESLGEAEFGEQCVGFIYGTVYHRPGLSLPVRQLVTVAALTTFGYASAQLAFHAKGALAVGCTRRQVVESIVQVSELAGFPATLEALTAVKEAFAGSGSEQVGDAAGSELVEALQEVAPDVARYVVECAFGDTDGPLDPKHREVVTIAACTALGTALPQLKAHIHALLDLGGSEREVVETLLHLAFYVGFPASLNGLAAAREVFAQRAAG